jgi:hypothetical protein
MHAGVSILDKMQQEEHFFTPSLLFRYFCFYFSLFAYPSTAILFTCLPSIWWVIFRRFQYRKLYSVQWLDE